MTNRLNQSQQPGWFLVSAEEAEMLAGKLSPPLRRPRFGNTKGRPLCPRLGPRAPVYCPVSSPASCFFLFRLKGFRRLQNPLFCGGS